ncbi:hypothetical protein T4E_11400 [Trichinella pseudospiralis]|uniref:Uncharacterized protein n=1 Tax=Trichinella pseudospiralis TaxID=6337 RepID=A0A0V0XT99_TRIPS|nr:hypothetical protein T4E_11400 [Trichinella pseudospiralis]
MLKKRKTKSKKQKEVNEKQTDEANRRRLEQVMHLSGNGALLLVNRRRGRSRCQLSAERINNLCNNSFSSACENAKLTHPLGGEPNRHTFETTVRLKPRRLGFLSSSLKRKTDAGYPLPVQTTTINAGPTVTN